jgi:hypothetical protein
VTNAPNSFVDGSMVPLPHINEAMILLLILLHPLKHKEDIGHLMQPSADKFAPVNISY